MASPDTQTLLTQLQAVYDAIQALRQRGAELQTVDHARAAYETLLAPEVRQQTELRQCHEKLELRWRQRLLAPREKEAELMPWQLGRQTSSLSAPVQWPSLPTPPPTRPALAGLRASAWKRLTRLVHGFQCLWQLDASLLGQVNRLADDRDRLLGEALALLPWRADAEHTEETEAAYLRRLTEWSAALNEYRQQLAAEMEMLETRFRGWLGIWQLWRQREQSATEQERWHIFIEEKRRTLHQEIDRLRKEIAALEQRLAETGGSS